MLGRNANRQSKGKSISAATINVLGEISEGTDRLTVTPPLAIKDLGAGRRAIYLDIGQLASTSSITRHAYGIVSSTVSPASSQSQPGTYGSGTVTLDVDGGAGYTAGDAVAVKNRWPTSFAIGDLLEIQSDDNGTTWFVNVRYCP